MKTQTEFIAEQIEKERLADLLPIGLPARQTKMGVACGCGKELHWDFDKIYGCGPYFTGVKCECGVHGYWDYWNKKFVWL